MSHAFGCHRTSPPSASPLTGSKVVAPVDADSNPGCYSAICSLALPRSALGYKQSPMSIRPCLGQVEKVPG